MGIESEGWAERCAGKSPQGSAFTTPTRSYGNQCIERTASAATAPCCVAASLLARGSPSLKTTTSFSARDAHPDAPPDLIARADAFARAMVDAARRDADEVRSIHWSPYERVGVVNADP